MAKFVLLGQAGVGHAGTAADPYSWTDLQTEVASPAPDTEFYIGAINDQVYSVGWLPDSVSGATVFHFYNWNYNSANPFPPYRIRFTGNNNLSGNWYNCIIEVIGEVYLGKAIVGGAQDFNLYSGYLIADQVRVGWYVSSQSFDIGFYGSSLKANSAAPYTGFMFYNPAAGEHTTITFKDSILDIKQWWYFAYSSGTISMIFENTAVGVLGSLKYESFVSLINSQDNWVNPNPWPTSSGTYDDFSYEDVLKGVAVVLSSSPHTGYTRGLWDEDRTRIGATSKFEQTFPNTIYWTVGSGGDYTTLNQAINALIALGALNSNYNIRLIEDNFETVQTVGTLDLNGHDITIINPNNYNTVASYGIYLRTNVNQNGGTITLNGMIINVIPAGWIPPFPTAIFAVSMNGNIIITNNRINCRDRWDIGIQTYISDNESTIKVINNMVSGCVRYGIRAEMLAV